MYICRHKIFYKLLKYLFTPFFPQRPSDCAPNLTLSAQEVFTEEETRGLGIDDKWYFSREVICAMGSIIPG